MALHNTQILYGIVSKFIFKFRFSLGRLPCTRHISLIFFTLWLQDRTRAVSGLWSRQVWKAKIAWDSDSCSWQPWYCFRFCLLFFFPFPFLRLLWLWQTTVIIGVHSVAICPSHSVVDSNISDKPPSKWVRKQSKWLWATSFLSCFCLFFLPFPRRY